MIAPSATKSPDTRFFGQPAGLGVLFFAEMWERFSYYGMRALLLLYLTADAARGDFQIITTMAHNAGIPKMIIDDAIIYHKKISESDTTFRGDNRDGILAASIYIACRINNYPRTAKEIASIFHLDATSATKGCKNALAIINNLEKDMDNKEKTNFGKTKPEAFIERYCSKLNINSELTRLC